MGAAIFAAILFEKFYSLFFYVYCPLTQLKTFQISLSEGKQQTYVYSDILFYDNLSRNRSFKH